MDDIYELILELCKDDIIEFKNSIDCPIDEDLDEWGMDNLLYYCFEININYFTDLIEKLLPLCEKAKSPLTEILYQGFATDEHWLIKKEVNA